MPGALSIAASDKFIGENLFLQENIFIDQKFKWILQIYKITSHPHQSEILEIWKSLGYEAAAYYELTGGIVAVHVGTVPDNI